jgi:hypothetical protein
MAVEEEKVIFTIEVDNEEAIKASEFQTEKIEELTAANERLRKEQKKVDSSTKEGLDERKRLGKVIEANNQDLKTEKQERTRLNKVIKTNSNSLAALRLENAKLNKQRANLDTSTKKGQQAFEELTKEIKKNKDAINGAEQAAGNFTGSVGNYKDSIKEALGSTNLFSGGLDKAAPGLSGVAGGIGGMTKAALKFIATPIGAIIALIVIAVKALAAAFSRNEGLMDTFSEAFAGISNVMEEVIGRIQRLIEIGGRLFKGQITLNEAIKEGSTAFDGMSESMKKAYDEGVKLKQLQVGLEEQNIKNTTTLAALNAEAEKQSAIADDNTRSFKEREEANKKATETARKSAEVQAQFARQELEEVNARIAQAQRQKRSTRELQLEQAEAIAKQIEAESNLTRVIFDNEKVRRELKQDRLEKDLDILIDGFDNQKTINEQLINDETLTFERRQEILAETQRLADESLAKQFETMEQFTGFKLDQDALLMESDAVVLNQKIRDLELSEIMEGRLLEIIRDRKTAVQDFSQTELDLIKKNAEFKKKDVKEREKIEVTQKKKEAKDKKVQDKLNAANDKLEADRLALRKSAIEGFYTGLTDATLAWVNGSKNAFGGFLKELADTLIDQLLIQSAVSEAIAMIRNIGAYGPFGVAVALGEISLMLGAAKVAKSVVARFADGGEVKTGMFHGASHSAGGITLSADGVPIAEVENDERFFVVNKRDSATIGNLSAINSQHGNAFSTPIQYAANGGEISTQGITAEQVMEMIQQTPIIVTVEDINEGQATRVDVVTGGTV